MPYVPDELKERIKREVSVERLAEARGIKLRRIGKQLIGLCPFHHDTNPSLRIDPAQNIWHCFGCERKGDVIEWVKHAEGVSFTHAVEMLKRDFLPVGTTSGGPPPKQSTVRKLPPLIEHTADDKRLLEIVVSRYHETLKQSPEAQQYLIKRGLQSAEMVSHFRLGFANRTLGYHLPASNRLAGAAQRGRLKQLGVIKNQTPGHEHFRGSVVIPIFNLNGEVVGMYGRKITPRHALREDTPEHLYLPGPRRGVWNEQALIASKEIILCEALIDALTFWCAGFRNVTSIYGVNGFTEEHRAAFQKHGTKRIYLAYDRDDAGEKAAQAHGEELMQRGIECFRVQFPKGQDANEFALKNQPAAKFLAMYLNSAAWLGKGKRPTVKAAAVEEPQAIEEAEEKPAAKEKISQEPSATVKEEIPAPPPEAAVKEKISEEQSEQSDSKEQSGERVFSFTAPLAAEPDEAVPVPEKSDVPVEINGDEIVIMQGDRRYRVRGLGKNTSYELLKVNLLVSSANGRGAAGFHVDTFDLYSARLRTVFVKQASEELGVAEETIRRDLVNVLRQMEELQEQQIKQALQPEEKESPLDEKDRAAAMQLLRDPRLLERVLTDFDKCGMVGEETNKLVSYLAVTSRLLDTPLAILVQASSAAGKSALMEAVLALLPEEQRVQYSAMTGQSLFYMGETDLKHKVLAIVEEEGAMRAAYALKLLQSEGVLTIASTGKDATTGRLITHLYRVEGPVMIFLTTTAIDLDEELLNRCLVLTVDEDRAQTQAIHRKQREAQTLEGLLAKHDRNEVLTLHRNVQRLLKPVFVANPYARELTFLDSQTRARRDHMKYLTLIRSITLLHQHQRPRKTKEHRGQTLEYIEVTKDDIATANRLAHEVLGRSLDELPPQTRRLVLLVDDMVCAECERKKIERPDFRFSRKDVRAFTKWSDSQLKRHLHRLEELEYLTVHQGGRGQSMVYELTFDRQEDSGRPVLPGLIEVEKLTGCSYDEKKSGVKEEKSGSSLAQVRGVSGGGAGGPSPVLTRGNRDFSQNNENSTDTGHEEENRIVGKPSARAQASGALPIVPKRAGAK